MRANYQSLLELFFSPKNNQLAEKTFLPVLTYFPLFNLVAVLPTFTLLNLILEHRKPKI